MIATSLFTADIEMLENRLELHFCQCFVNSGLSSILRKSEYVFNQLYNVFFKTTGKKSDSSVPRLKFLSQLVHNQAISHANLPQVAILLNCKKLCGLVRQSSSPFLVPLPKFFADFCCH